MLFWRSFRCVFGVPCSFFPLFFTNPATSRNVQKKRVCEREREWQAKRGEKRSTRSDGESRGGVANERNEREIASISLETKYRTDSFFRISVGCGFGCRRQRQEVKNSHNQKSKRNEVLLKLGGEKGRPVRFCVFFCLVFGLKVYLFQRWDGTFFTFTQPHIGSLVHTYVFLDQRTQVLSPTLNNCSSTLCRWCAEGKNLFWEK